MGSFVYVLFGSTKVITIGPTSLLSLASYDAVVSMGPEAAILLTFLSGLICLLLGLLNLGDFLDNLMIELINKKIVWDQFQSWATLGRVSFNL